MSCPRCSMRKPWCGRGGGGCVSSGVAESVLWNYRHGLERAMMRGSVGIVGIGCIVGELGWRVCCSDHGSATNGSNIRKNRSCGITPCQVDIHIKQNV